MYKTAIMLEIRIFHAECNHAIRLTTNEFIPLIPVFSAKKFCAFENKGRIKAKKKTDTVFNSICFNCSYFSGFVFTSNRDSVNFHLKCLA